MPPDSPLGIGIVGLGFMGKAHLEAYHAAISDGLNTRITAVADPDPARLEAFLPPRRTTHPSIVPPKIIKYRRAADLFADDQVHLVSICTPTDTHIELATQALNLGKHVLLEKPVALTEPEVSALADIATKANRICIPAMCMRFWPAWQWLKQTIVANTHGPIRAARFERLGPAPAWNQSFYQDISRSGGALFDLHIHDTDFIVHCFGIPQSVTTHGDCAHATTTYHFSHTPAIIQAQGGWLPSPHFPFRMRYTVVFEHAVADFDLTRDTPLLLHTPDATTSPTLETITGYDGEIRLAIQSARSGVQPSPALQDAAIVTRVLEAELESLRVGRPIQL